MKIYTLPRYGTSFIWVFAVLPSKFGSFFINRLHSCSFASSSSIAGEGGSPDSKNNVSRREEPTADNSPAVVTLRFPEMRRCFLQRTAILRNPSREICRPALIKQQCRFKVTTSKAKATTSKAKAMLGFSQDCKPTIIDLRTAYYEAAKKCHPDVKGNDQTLDFRELKDAYEHLVNGGHVSNDESEVTVDDENDYRRACMDILGLKAEIVEESKQNPMFLHWLSGKTDGAQYWRNFFTAHGGLAQKLRPPDGYLMANVKHIPKASESRRRRRR